MNDLLKTFIDIAKCENPEWRPVKINDVQANLCGLPLLGQEQPCVDLTSDRASAEAIIAILYAIQAKGYTVQILTFADSVAEPEERFQVFAWRSLNEHRKGPNDGNSSAGPTLIGCAVDVYNAIHAPAEEGK